MKTIVEFPDKGLLAEEAAEWLMRLDSDVPPTRQELQTLGEWLHRSPAHREELERLAALWNRLNVLTELAVPLGKPQPEVSSRRPKRVGGGARRLRPALVVMAIGVFALGVTWMLRDVYESYAVSANGLYATAVGQQQATRLPDGSQVLLNTNSQARVTYTAQYREVRLLQGEAHFTVTKDTDRPFRVYAGNGRIQAIGTSFSVYIKGSDVQVTVTEGHVSLASQRSLAPIIPRSTASPSEGPSASLSRSATQDEWIELPDTLSAGQVATIHSTEEINLDSGSGVRLIEESLPPAELERRLAWRNGILMFSGDRLEDVVREVSRYTTTSISIPDPAVRNMRIGGRFPVGETEVMLAALESSFNLQVTHLGHDRVIVTASD